MFSLAVLLFEVIFAVAVLTTLEGARRALTGARVNREMRAYAGLPAVARLEAQGISSRCSAAQVTALAAPGSLLGVSRRSVS
jgi:hypothetical protein